MNADQKTRRDRYHDLGSRLAHVSDAQLNALLGAQDPNHGWGGTHVIPLGPSKVFVKIIPITRLEYENPFSTENLYGLPTYYNYGVGSAGFGAFREIVAHIKTTHWVLDGSIDTFPLMYHYRIRPFSGPRRELNEERHQGYVKYWGSHEAIDRYIRARSSAEYEAVLFLEHVPAVLDPWLRRHPDRWESVIRDLRRTIAFLRSRGVLHFDVHFRNILVDDERPYLTDFGLVLDRQFHLSPEEKAFFSRHTDYDYAEFVSCMGSYLDSIFGRLSDRRKQRILRRYGLEAETDHFKRMTVLVAKIEEIHADGLMDLDDHYVEQVVGQRRLIARMHGFYSRLLHNEKKDTPYPRAAVRRLLTETGFR